MAPAAAGQAPIEHTGSGTTDTPAGRRSIWRVGDALPAGLTVMRCTYCGTITCCAYEATDDGYLCSWCHTARAALVREAPQRPRGRAQLGNPHTAARARPTAR
jgi:hypothetical protein